MTADEIIRIAKAGASGNCNMPTLEDYDLGGYDCPKCGNKGIILLPKDGYLYSRECDCMPIRRSLRKIRKSGMADMLKRYTFNNYQTPTAETKKIKKLAQEYARKPEKWLYISGRSGSGKTHICTAICAELIQAGKETYYMSWKDESTRLKAIINTADYEPRIQKLKTVAVLYVDDFFKGGATDADIRLAFEILNNRYNDTALVTIISSEYPVEFVLDKDEALGGRIYERAMLLKAPGENWRLK